MKGTHSNSGIGVRGKELRDMDGSAELIYGLYEAGHMGK